MVYKVDQSIMSSLVSALVKPHTAAIPSANVTAALDALARDGWITENRLEDVLFSMDRRLDDYVLGGISAVRHIYQPHVQPVTKRTSRQNQNPFFTASISSIDVAHLLIQLEQTGFSVDPSPLVNRLLPALTDKVYLSLSEESVVQYHSRRHKSDPLTFLAKYTDDIPGPPKTFRLANGYRVEISESVVTGLPVRIRVFGNRYRMKPPARAVVCDTCGWEFEHGDRESSSIHRIQHRDRMHYLDPQPSMLALKSQAKMGCTALKVLPGSPRWMHKEMYRRAIAFQREERYDFVMWNAPSSEPSDMNAVGYLLTTHDARIVGAVSFRWREYADSSVPARWALQWVWIAPKYRRTGVLSSHWDVFENTHGHFLVESPLSPSMKAFLDGLRIKPHRIG